MAWHRIFYESTLAAKVVFLPRSADSCIRVHELDLLAQAAGELDQRSRWNSNIAHT